jgi:hypothetical protein
VPSSHHVEIGSIPTFAYRNSCDLLLPCRNHCSMHDVETRHNLQGNLNYLFEVTRKFNNPMPLAIIPRREMQQGLLPRTVAGTGTRCLTQPYCMSVSVDSYQWCTRDHPPVGYQFQQLLDAMELIAIFALPAGVLS